MARPPLSAVAATEPPLTPRLAFVRTPVWEQAEPVTRAALSELVRELGGVVTELELGAGFADAVAMHRTVMEVEMAHNLRRDYDKGGDQLSVALREIIQRGRGHTAVDYMAAVAGIASLNRALDTVFDEFDALLTPAAAGQAPHGLEFTGNAVFCTLWTFLGTPAVTLPLLRSEAGMPLGVQLVGRRDNDARLLRTARWLVDMLRRGGERRDAGRSPGAPGRASRSRKGTRA